MTLVNNPGTMEHATEEKAATATQPWGPEA